MRADVFIQAGHRGRTSGATGASNPRVGISELADIPVITQRATDRLRAAGVTVIHEDASLSEDYYVDLAVFAHFDGAVNPAVQKASVGYDDPTDEPAASDWKAAYGEIWPFGFHRDNFTSNLSGYYGYRYTKTTDSEFVIEFGTISNDEAARWLKDRLLFLGDFLAWWITQRIGKGSIEKPTYQDPTDLSDIEARLAAVEKETKAQDARIRGLQAQYGSHQHSIPKFVVPSRTSSGPQTG